MRFENMKFLLTESINPLREENTDGVTKYFHKNTGFVIICTVLPEYF